MAASEGQGSLGACQDRIRQFMAAAATAPAPACIEDDDDDDGDKVQMNLLLGVMEQRERVGSTDGILLPTAGTRQQLEEREQDDARALVGILRALAGTPNSDDTSVAIDSSGDDSDDDAAPTAVRQGPVVEVIGE